MRDFSNKCSFSVGANQFGREKYEKINEINGQIQMRRESIYSPLCLQFTDRTNAHSRSVSPLPTLTHIARVNIQYSLNSILLQCIQCHIIFNGVSGISCIKCHSSFNGIVHFLRCTFFSYVYCSCISSLKSIAITKYMNQFTFLSCIPFNQEIYQ